MASKIKVTLGKFPGTVFTKELDGSCSINVLLTEAQMSADGYEITLNDQPATLESTVKHGDEVVLNKPIKGN